MAGIDLEFEWAAGEIVGVLNDGAEGEDGSGADIDGDLIEGGGDVDAMFSG